MKEEKILTEEEYLEQCRKEYRKKMDDASFVVRRCIQNISERIHPDNTQAAWQMRGALSRLVRSHFNVQGLANLRKEHKEPAIALLEAIEGIVMEGKA